MLDILLGKSKPGHVSSSGGYSPIGGLFAAFSIANLNVMARSSSRNYEDARSTGDLTVEPILQGGNFRHGVRSLDLGAYDVTSQSEEMVEIMVKEERTN